LETGVIKDENEVIKWDGTPQKFPEWNKDQTMRSAIAGSVIWFYQELARRIGQETNSPRTTPLETVAN
jgi:beta-lactamase class D